MKKSEAIKLLESEDWTKADAIRALEGIDFDNDPDELTVRRSISPFTGSELSKRQRLQAAQKGMVTKKTKEVEWKDKENSNLEVTTKTLSLEKSELLAVNDQLKKDNKALKNLVDAIRLKIAIDMKQLVQYEDSEIRKALVKWFKGTQG